jgi:ABC-type Fe3+/spermidine/putrescine transport system ATPase subunit
MTELRLILKRVGVTALYVTHDQQEAFAVADRIVVMQRGSVEQIGAPQAIHDRPASEFVARFLGFHNLLPATVSPPGEDGPGRVRVETRL